MDCSAVHRKMGTHITFVRSLDLDQWSEAQLMQMAVGGNGRAKAGFIANGYHDMRGKATTKYSSGAAAAYKAKLRATADAQMRAGRKPLDLAGSSRDMAASPSASPTPLDSVGSADDAPLGSAWVDMRSAEAEATADDARRRADEDSRKPIVMRSVVVPKGSLSVAAIAGGPSITLGRKPAAAASRDGEDDAPAAAAAHAPATSKAKGDDPFGDDWGFDAGVAPAGKDADARASQEKDDAALAAAMQAAEMSGGAAPGSAASRALAAAEAPSLYQKAGAAGPSGGRAPRSAVSAAASGPSARVGGARKGPSVARPVVKRPGLGAVGAVSGAARADKSTTVDRSRLKSVGVGKPGLGGVPVGAARSAAPGLGSGAPVRGGTTSGVGAATRDDFFDQW